MRKIIIPILCIYASLHAFAQPARKRIETAGTATQFPHSAYMVIFDSTKVDMAESGLSYYNEHKLVKILSTAGAKQFATYRYDYDPLSAYVQLKKLVIYYANGLTKELNAGNEIDYPAPGNVILWGARQKMIELGRLEPGDAFEVFVSKKGFTYALLDQGTDEDSKYIPPMRGHFYDIVPFWSDVPVNEKVYEVTIPNTKQVQYKIYNGKVSEQKKVGSDKTWYSFSLKKITPFTTEPNMVAASDVAPKLLISTSPDWFAKSKWFYKVNEDYGSFESTPEIDRKVKEILKGAKSEIDSVGKLTHWVADEFRYFGLSMGKGEGYTLHKASMTYLDRCGVCKDKAGMLVSMLRSAGFEAYAAMTMAGSRIDLIPADQFNHSVTVVKLSDGKLHLLDPTWVPFVRELWSSAEQQQNYLPGLPQGSDLLETPISDPENHYVKISASSKLAANGTLSGEIHITAEGQSDAALRRLFTGSYKALWTKNVENELLKIYPQGKVVSSFWGNDPYNYQSGPIELRINYEIPDFATVTSNEIIFRPLASSGIFDGAMRYLNFDLSLAERKFPFKDGCSRSIEITDKTVLPARAVFAWKPEPSQVSGTGAQFASSCSLSGNKLTVQEKASFKKRVYTPEDWPSFRESVKMQKMFIENPFILKIEK
jgi:hypothetical protein